MQGLAADDRVIYVGTFSKTLFPAMRLGFIVLPIELAECIRPAINITGQFPPLVLQAALADFIAAGLLLPPPQSDAPALRAASRRCSSARWRRTSPTWLSPIDGRTGIQIAAPFVRDDIDDREIVARAAEADVNVAPLSLYFHGDVAMRGLLMGYAGVAEKDMRKSLSRLRDVFQETVGFVTSPRPFRGVASHRDDRRWRRKEPRSSQSFPTLQSATHCRSCSRRLARGSLPGSTRTSTPWWRTTRPEMVSPVFAAALHRPRRVCGPLT